MEAVHLPSSNRSGINSFHRLMRLGGGNLTGNYIRYTVDLSNLDGEGRRGNEEKYI